MILLNMAGFARPVRMAANSSLATSTALSIFSSASRRVSSITAAPCGSGGGRWAAQDSDARSWPGSPARPTSARDDPRADPLTPDGAGDVAITLHAEDHHRQVVLHAEAEGGGVHHAQAAPDRVREGHGLEQAGVRGGAGVAGGH